jgi:FKBP-type peptidyl-prolyl cis-trans isomerase
MRAFTLAVSLSLASAVFVLPACGQAAKPVKPSTLKCSAVTPSGLGYKILKAGKGAKPIATDTVRVNYIGYLPKTGEVFDAGDGIEFGVSDVVPGFSEGLQLMQPGGKIRLCLPSRLAYGARAIGPIAANSDLVFFVQLISATPMQ